METTSSKLSIIIPTFNEMESLEELSGRIQGSQWENLTKSFEILFIDDGSNDGSNELIRRMAEQSDKISLIELKTNLGKSMALRAGSQHASGDLIINMDADLQDHPEDIPHLLTAIQESGCDLVSGWRKNRNDQKTRKLGSKIYNFAIRVMTGLKINDQNCVDLRSTRNI